MKKIKKIFKNKISYQNRCVGLLPATYDELLIESSANRHD
tara:strand:+ start:138 stop:257 length:120 start_codon:yes stop_codon:yes gene_type:complete